MSVGPESARLHARAQKISPGGVHGAARFYTPGPLFFRRMEGQFLWDADGHRYLDLHGSFGAVALGHNDPEVQGAVKQVLENEGVLFGAPHPREVDLSEKLTSLLPCAEVVALCGGGGSDPLYVGFRLARSITGRSRLLKFEGSYHGWHDPLAVSVMPPLEEAGPADRPNPVPSSAGAAEGSLGAIIGRLNQTELLEDIFRRWGGELACAVVEPVAHTIGCVIVEEGFLRRLRDLCNEHGVVLMFDEVITGFRHSLYGAQAIVGVTPDLAAIGKAMANGFWASALVGRRQFMSGLTPLGPAVYSGTFCGHLLSVVAAQATIDEMEKKDIHRHTFALGDYVRSELNTSAEEYDVRAVCQSFGSIYCLYFGVQQVREYRDVARVLGAREINREFQQALLRGSIFMHPTSVNRSFLSAAHTTEDVARIIDVTVDFMRQNRDRINTARVDPT